MEKMQEKGELGEDELKALEMDVTGKVQFPLSAFPLRILTALRIRSCWRRGGVHASRSCRCCGRHATGHSRSQAFPIKYCTTGPRYLIIALPSPFILFMSPCAQGLLLLGAIFKATVPDETDEERRELERWASFTLLSRRTHSYELGTLQDGGGGGSGQVEASADAFHREDSPEGRRGLGRCDAEGEACGCGARRGASMRSWSRIEGWRRMA